MTEEVDSLWQSLSLTEDEADVTYIEDSSLNVVRKETMNCLIGKVLKAKPVNKEAFRSRMKQLWRLSKGLSIVDNIFIFKFNHELERRRVLMNGPWSFDKSLVVLKEMKEMDQPSSIKFHNLSF